MTTLEEFILEHENEDAARLLLSGSIIWPTLPAGFPNSSFSPKDILVNTISGRKRVKSKLPSWYNLPGIIYPTRLSTEQCSSETTAAIKAGLCKRILELSGKDNTGTIADLTSGLGVDVWAFSSIADSVLYNDMDESLFLAAKNNYALLGKDNITFSNRMVDKSSVDEILSERFQSPDIIFLDPARRSTEGKKVFLLEDCSPDVLGIMDSLLSHSSQIVLKLSPMADITMVVDRLSKVGAPVREVHVVSTEGECKELLIWIDVNYQSEFSIMVHEDNGVLEVAANEEADSVPCFVSDMESLNSFPYLFEPGKSLTKAGLFNLISQKFGSVKAGRSTHLYFMSEEIFNDGKITDLGKTFKIIEAIPMSGKAVKETGKKYPKSEVSAKNIPMTSDELRKKLSVKSGDDAHIFGIKMDFSQQKSQNILLVTKRIK